MNLRARGRPWPPVLPAYCFSSPSVAQPSGSHLLGYTGRAAAEDSGVWLYPRPPEYSSQPPLQPHYIVLGQRSHGFWPPQQQAEFVPLPPQQGMGQSSHGLYQPRPQPRGDIGQTFMPRSRQNGLSGALNLPRLADYRRTWQPARSPPRGKTEGFKVLSYNILADYLARKQPSELYSHIPDFIIDWEWRKSKLLFEIQQLWSPDIMCLQEVDKFHDLEAELRLRGYNGIWKMRTGIAVDGCAIFWRSKRFNLLHEESIEFIKLDLKDNVAQICVLETTAQVDGGKDASLSSSVERSDPLVGNRLVICNIHVLYNPRRGEIKLGQIRTLLDRAYAVSRQWQNAPVVLCGDFNSKPKSPIYNFIHDQKLDFSMISRYSLSGQSSESSSEKSHDVSSSYRSAPSFEIANCIKDVMSSLKNNQNQSAQRFVPQSAYAGTGVAINKDMLPGLTMQTGRATSLDIPESAGLGCHKELANNSGRSVETAREANFNVASATLRSCDSSSVDNLPDVSVANDSSKLSDSFGHLHLTEIEQTSHESSVGEASAINPTSMPDSDHQMEHPFQTPQNDDLVRPEASNENADFNFHTELLGSADENILANELSLQANAEKGDPPDRLETNKSLDGNVSSSYHHYPYFWKPEEIRSASGNEMCMSVEHSLKLRSVYTDAEDTVGTRDQHGEPQVTSYNARFMGTVDYIWCTDGLQTVKVLDTIPKQVLLQTAGFPTKKWGSDHLALVCELAFTPST